MRNGGQVQLLLALDFVPNLQCCCSPKAILGTLHKNRSCSARLVNVVAMTSVKAVNLVLLDRKCA